MSKDIIINYEDDDGNKTERRISEIEPVQPNSISAYCHLRNAKRIFVIQRITSARYFKSNRKVKDLYKCFGYPKRYHQLEQVEDFDSLLTPSTPKRNNKTSIDQRKREKQELFTQFINPQDINLIKQKFFSLFNYSCFKCGSKELLDIDHHIPFKLGGHLVPGNLVALCKKCNNKKRDSHPRDFYTSKELSRLEPLLKEQIEIFKFKYSWKNRELSERRYVISLGIDPETHND